MYIFATFSFLRCLGEGTKFGRDMHTETRMSPLVIFDKATVYVQIPLAAGCAFMISERGAQKSTSSSVQARLVSTADYQC